MSEKKIWKQERPNWCTKSDCGFRRRVTDSFCGGILPEPAPHKGDFNTYRLCFYDGHLDYYMLNDSDLNWLRWVFDALDGRETGFKGTMTASGRMAK